MSRPWLLWSARRSSWGPASIFCGTRPDARRLRGLPEVARHDRSAWLGNVAFADTYHRTRLDQDRHDSVAQRFRRCRLDQELVHAKPKGFAHQRALRAGGEQDDWQLRLRKDARRTHDLEHLWAAQDRQCPIHDCDIRIRAADDVERGNTVAGFVDRLRTDVHEHHAGDLAHVLVFIGHQDTEALDLLVNVLLGHG